MRIHLFILLSPFLCSLLWAQSLAPDRTEIRQRLEAKKAAGEPWIAHVIVPLCDNDHQGIVPVNASLGNGQNTRTNLYWGAGYGVRTHFKRSDDWMTQLDEVPASKYILDRVVWEKTFPDGHRVIFVADAYDGAYMQQALEDYFDYLAGKKACTLRLDDGRTIQAGKGADLLVMNGHNGLMDVDVDIPRDMEAGKKDAVVIACISRDYFIQPLNQAGAYPLLTTTGLMAPEAYVVRAVLDAWGAGKSGAEIRKAAGAAYHRYQKCGLNGATRLFHTGQH